MDFVQLKYSVHFYLNLNIFLLFFCFVLLFLLIDINLTYPYYLFNNVYCKSYYPKPNVAPLLTLLCNDCALVISDETTYALTG